MIKKISIFVVLALILLTAGSAIYLNCCVSRDVISKVNKEIQEKSNGLYTFEAATASIELLRGKVQFTEVEISSDTIASRSSKYSGHFTTKTAGITVKSFIKALFGGGLEIAELAMENPVATVVHNKEIAGDTTSSKNGKTQKLQLIELHNAKITFLEKSHDQTDTVFQSAGIHLNIQDLVLNPDSVPDFEKLTFSSSGLCMPVPGRPEFFETDSLEINSELGTAQIANLVLDIDIPGRDYAPAIGIQKGANSFHIDQLQIEGLNVKELLFSKFMNARKIDITGFKLLSEKYKIHDQLPVLHKPLPVEFLKKIPLSLHCDSINVADMNATVFQVNKKGKKGIIKINDIGFLLKNVTNSDNPENDKPMHLSGSCVLGENSKVYVQGYFALNDPHYGFELNGRSFGIDAADFNKFVEPLSSIRFKSGQLKDLKFHFNADSRFSKGTFQSRFESVRIESNAPPGEETGKEKIQRKLTAFGGNLLLGTADLIAGDEISKGEIRYEREPEKSVFNYWIMSIFSGVTDAMSLDIKKVKREKK